MKKPFLGLLAATTALITAAPASADDSSASVRAVFDAGRCIVERDRGAAVGLIRSLPIEDGNADLSRLPANVASRCAGNLSSAETLYLRGGIAQALFLRDFGSFGVEPSRAIPLVNLDLPVQDSPPGSRTVELYRWADCLVRNDATHSERLLSSRIGSHQEEAALNGLRAFMAACAPAGAELSVHPAELRSVIAQSAYQTMYRYWTRQLAPIRDQ